jgi:Flp pilus assembly protein TadD
MNETNIDDVLQRSKVLRAEGKDHEAIELLTRAIGDQPDARLYFLRGTLFDLIDQPEQAVSDFTSAIELDGSNPEYYLNRGCVLSHSLLQRDNEAIHDFEKVLELDPDNIDGYRECCMSLLVMGRPNRAWERAMEALRLAPHEAVTHFCVGESQMSLELFSDALKSFERAVKLDPGKAHYWSALRRAREKLGGEADLGSN